MAQFPARDVSLIQALRRLLRRTPPALDSGLWERVRERTPWLAPLDDARELRIRQLTARFLHQKEITSLAGLELDPFQRMQLAAVCSLPLMEIGEPGLNGWSQVLVYPQAFRVQRSHVDAAGVEHQYEDELIGESWDAGPLVLSWADIQADLADPRAGFCVAIHEMAHKLDAMDGAMDGTPLLPGPWQREWAADFQSSFDGFVALVESGAPSPIDDYAAESPEEFFAVSSEYHFSSPALLREHLPRVAAHLERLYGPPIFG